jgi:long-chain acyl-CoA synthetase
VPSARTQTLQSKRNGAQTGVTLTQIFDTSTEKFAKTPALRWKTGSGWTDLSYADLRQRVEDFAGGLLALGMDRGDRVAIFSKNCPEWAITDWAAVVHGFVTVPIYDTLTAEKAAYILKDAGARVCVVQTKAQLEKVRSVRKQLPALRHVVVIDEVFEKFLETGEHLFDQVYKMGRAHNAKHKTDLTKLRSQVKPDDLASIVYTSGTTGEPKGAMLTHNNFASNVDAALSIIPFEPGYVTLSFLPLSHVFERMAGHFTMVRAGCTIAYAESIEKVPDNLQEIKPHTMMSVPRLYEKLYARVQEKVKSDSFLKRFIFGKAIETGKKYVHEKYTLKVENPSTVRKYKRYDKLVFSKLRERVGGRLLFFVSGGAPLSAEIHEFFTAASLPILIGYGLTETSPVISANSLSYGFRIGSAGKPLPGADVQIASDGEILVKGPMVFQGYWKKPADTKEAFTRDGYFKTGDIGHLDEDGFLYITDRKKELLVMSNGKKVAPQPIENLLKTQPGVGMAVLVGNNRNYITALLSPDTEAVKKHAQAKGVSDDSLAELVTHPEVQRLFVDAVARVNEDLSQYEKIKRFKVLPAELTQETGELTPTLKVKRRVVDEKYQALVDELYAAEPPAAMR